MQLRLEAIPIEAEVGRHTRVGRNAQVVLKQERVDRRGHGKGRGKGEQTLAMRRFEAEEINRIRPDIFRKNRLNS